MLTKHAKFYTGKQMIGSAIQQVFLNQSINEVTVM